MYSEEVPLLSSSQFFCQRLVRDDFNRSMKPSEPFPQIGTHVALRRLRADDLQAFQAYRHDPEVGHLQGWVPEPDETAREFLEAMGRAIPFVPGVWFQIGIAEKSTDLLIGDIGVIVSQDQRVSEIGISLGKASQGRGLATEALSMIFKLLFDHSSIESITAITDQRNQSAIRLLGRAGMRQVSTQDAEFRGLPCTEITFSLPRPSTNGW